MAMKMIIGEVGEGNVLRGQGENLGKVGTFHGKFVGTLKTGRVLYGVFW